MHKFHAIQRPMHGLSVLVLLVFVAFAAVAKQPTAASKADTTPVEFSVTLLDGKTFQAKDQRGRYLLVNYWATWCRPCIKELPEFEILSKKRSDLRVLGLAFEEIEDVDLKAFLSKLKITFPNSKVDVYGPPPVGKSAPKGLPMTYLFDSKGVLVKQFLGPVTAADITALLPKS